MTYDYIIVGTGAGGSVLADRLSASGKHSVLVLEAGGSDRNPIHRVPKGFYFTMQEKKYTKHYKTEPFGDDTAETWQRGWINGGSTTINGMVWNRGGAAAYDAWEAAGNKGWNSERFVDAWKQIEAHELGATGSRGGHGPVHIEVAKAKNPVSDAMIQAAENSGVQFVDDMNSTDVDRIALVTSNTHRGFRRSAATTFLGRARKRKNVKIINRAEVTKVLFSGRRAVGVEAQVKGRLVQFSAGREVLVSGGALESPLILERSGIGKRDALEAAGVDVLVESPRVGENLSEHRGIMLQFRFDGKVGFNHTVNTPLRQLLSGAKYLLDGKGVISFGGYDVLGMYRSDPNSADVDTQLFFTPVSTAGSNPIEGKLSVDEFSGAMAIAYPVSPTSRGSIHITGPRVSDAPRIVPNYLDTEHDRDLVVKVTRKLRELMASNEMKSLGAQEIQPGVEKINTDDEILDYSLNHGASGYHTLGTCSIGPDEQDVVDVRLRVRGVSGLRVVDASVFPEQPSGNNNAPTLAVSWIAADMILEDAENAAIEQPREESDPIMA
jgi:choline dehydrogenase